jgi:murein DD-endopeptidase MepM/ murein hydrolase activator NlpD
LVASGHKRATVVSRVFRPFPVGGLTTWSDSWGAPRYAGGYHPHHGQDLLCRAGTPILAVEPGTIRLSSDPLGGTTLLLERPDGSYWYYAHLRSYASGIGDGTTVTTGQRIASCGATGDATVPHLHFSLFSAAGKAIDPMPWLVRWLHVAEDRSGVRRSTGKGVAAPADVGEEYATDIVSPTSVVVLTPPPTPISVEPTPPIPGSAVVGMGTLLVFLPLASRRVRAAARRGAGRLSRSAGSARPPAG